MATGNVKWFSKSKGYGFILADDGDIEVFAHYSAIEAEGFRTLHPGQRVEFELLQGEKGPSASAIRLLDGDRPGRGRGGRWLRRPGRPTSVRRPPPQIPNN